MSIHAIILSITLILSTNCIASTTNDDHDLDQDTRINTAQIDSDAAWEMPIDSLKIAITDLQSERDKYKKYMNSSDDEAFKDQLARRSLYMKFAGVLKPISDILIFGTPVAISFAQGMGAGSTWTYTLSGVAVVGGLLNKAANYFNEESWNLRKNAMKKYSALQANALRMEGILAQRLQGESQPTTTSSTTKTASKKNLVKKAQGKEDSDD